MTRRAWRMPATRPSACTLLLCLLTCVACDTGDRQEETAADPAPALPARPQAITDTLWLEGMPEVVTSNLLTAPEGVTPPFSTYLPPGITMQVDSRGDSAAVRFSASFAGPADPNAYMHFRAYPPGTDHAAARNVVQAFLRSRRPQDDPIGSGLPDPPHQPVEPPSWGEEAHTFSYAGHGNVQFTGRIVLARHGSRFIHILTHYPVEFGDGLGPRFERILRHWRWEDTGEMLMGQESSAGAPDTAPIAPDTAPIAPDTGPTAPDAAPIAPDTGPTALVAPAPPSPGGGGS